MNENDGHRVRLLREERREMELDILDIYSKLREAVDFFFAGSPARTLAMSSHNEDMEKVYQSKSFCHCFRMVVSQSEVMPYWRVGRVFS